MTTLRIKIKEKKITLAAALITICMLAGWGSKDTNISGDNKQSINFYGTLSTWANPKEQIQVDNISIENIFKKIPMYVKQSNFQTSNKKKRSQAAVKKAASLAEQAAKSAKKAVQAAKKVTKQQDNATINIAAKAAQQAAQAATAAAAAITTAIPTTNTTKTTEKKHILLNDPKTSLIEAEIDLVEVSEILVPFPDETWIYQKDDKSRKYKFIQITIISDDPKKTKTNYLIEKRKKIFCNGINAAGPIEQKVPITALKRLIIKGYKDRALQENKRRQEEEREKIKRLAQKTK